MTSDAVRLYFILSRHVIARKSMSPKAHIFLRSPRSYFLLILVAVLMNSFFTSLRQKTPQPTIALRQRLSQMASHLNNGNTNGDHGGRASIRDLPKSSIFTQSLPPDSAFPTPKDSHNAPREKLGPRLVKGALYTFIRPEPIKEPELVCVSEAALRDIGIKPEEVKSEDFKNLVAGNKIISWDEDTGEGVYPWAQCYGGTCLVQSGQGVD